MKDIGSRIARFGSSRLFAILLLTLVLVLVAAVYSEVLSFQFLPFWDDDTNIHRNPLYSPLSWGSVLLFWKAPFQQLYIPVTYSAWAALVALSRLVSGTSISFGPLNPVLFHGTNLIVHLFSTAMLFLILRRLLGAYFVDNRVSSLRILFAAAAGSLAFALHPIQVEAVAWVSGLRDLLGGTFSLAAIALLLSWLDEFTANNFAVWFRYAAASGCLLLAFGSKPGSVVTPALSLLCGAWLLYGRRRSWKPLLWLVPWFALALIEVVLTSRAQPAAELARTLVPVWARPLVAGDAFAFYLGKLLWPIQPWGLCADYGRSPNSLLNSEILFWTWVIPVALILLLLLRSGLRCYLLPLSLMVVGVLPTLGFIPFNFQVVSTVSDRYLYLAMMGPALAFALMVCRLPFRMALLLPIVLLSGWAALTLMQLPQWADGEVFFPATLSRNPTSWKSRHNYACTLDAHGKLPEALKEFEEAIRLRPTNAEAHNDMALTLLKLGRRQDAIIAFQHSLQIRPTCGAARNLAAVLLLSGAPAQAASVYRMAMQIDPGDLQNQRALAWLLATHPDDRIRNGREAVSLSEQIVSATDSHVPVYLLTLGASLAEAGDFDRSIQVASQAADAYQRSGDPKMALMIQQRILPALKNHQAIRDNPAQPQ